jgi:hypothetical protein
MVVHDVYLTGFSTQRAGMARGYREAAQDRPLWMDVKTHAGNLSVRRKAGQLDIVASGC